ncbi:hypothetical protein MKX01_027791 [Papaver californicum]|nr:hypothetical protein MKX01_027791 [Papaver californicum]
MAPKAKEKPKSSPQQPTVVIEDLFNDLNHHVQNSQFEKAVKIADQVLAIAPGDEDALNCKIVALIKDDNIDFALSTIQSLKNVTVNFGIYKAYCLYRQNKLDEAMESLSCLERTSVTMQLESQILYRLGKMEPYSIEINIVAGLVSAGRAFEVQGTMNALKVKPNSSFELAYNNACSLIERQKHVEAEHQLLSARRIGQETLMEDNWADDEIEMELAPIAVQLAYVWQLLGHPKEALETYVDIITRNLSNDSSLAVAINNLIALKGPKDASDGLRKLDKLIEKGNAAHSFQLARGLDLKLSSKQKEAIYTNRVFLLLHASRVDQARELVTAFSEMFPGSVMPTLLQAAVFVKENKAVKAEEILGQFANQFPEKSKVPLLARAQVAAAANHAKVAVDSLSRIPDIQRMPATVATLVSLKERDGDIDGAAAVLDSAITWWSNAMSDDNKLEAARFKLKHGREEEAAHLYEGLFNSHKSVEALVGLVTTAAQADVEKAETYEKKLKPLPRLKGVNVDSLEKTSGAKHVENNADLCTVEDEEAKGKAKSKKKRKQKPKYPKGFDPKNPGPPPDPERWLPKRERSSYRPKRKDKRAQIRGSQGSVSRDKQDISNAAASSTNTSNSKLKPDQATTTSTKPAAEQSKPSPSRSSKKKSRNFGRFGHRNSFDEIGF